MWHDLESFIHVLHWMCARFHLTNYSDDMERLRQRVSGIYDASYSSKTGIFRGGDMKMTIMQTGTVPFQLVDGSAGHTTPGLSRLLTDLAVLYKAHYESLKSELPTVRRDVAHSLASSNESKTRALSGKQLAVVPLPARRLAKSRVRTVVQETPALALLEDHTEIMLAFENVLHPDQDPWILDEKVGDNFAHFKTHMDQQSRVSRESFKRSADHSVDDRADKRIRSDTSNVSVSTTPLLGSIVENVDG